MFVQRCGASYLSALYDAGHVSCGKHFLCPENFVTNRCIVVLFGTSLSGHALQNASRIAANNFDEVMFENEHTFCSSIYHVRTCTAFAQLAWAAALQPGWAWLKCHGGGWECLLHGGWPASDWIFNRSTWLLLGCVSSGTPCINHTNTNSPWLRSQKVIGFVFSILFLVPLYSNCIWIKLFIA
jgi:hypothetical protein